MQKIKLFKSIENELENLEQEVNDWLASTGNRLVSVCGNIAPQTHSGDTLGTFPSSDVLIIVVYEGGNE